MPQSAFEVELAPMEELRSHSGQALYDLIVDFQ